MPDTTQPLLLAGRWSEGSGGAVDEIENPATEEIIARVSTANDADVESAVAEAVRAQKSWARVPAAGRAAVLHRLATLIERDADRLAGILVAELGKPIIEARAEVGAAAGFCQFFAGIITTQGGEVLPLSSPSQEMWLRREPIGVVAGIIPWNFPLALAARKLAPALVTGNAIVLKPAELTPLSALAIAELAIEAGVPEGLLSVLPGRGAVIGTALVQNPAIGFVTMTGSVRAGRSILHNAADRIIPVSLELGGKAPFIVFADADLDAAAEAAIATRMMNNGQACVANERTYVERSVFDEFTARMAARLESMVIGDPADEATQAGPKASNAELLNVERIVGAAVDAGARIVTGGERPSGGAFDRGYWYRPTLLADVSNDSPVLQEEVFGPVLPVVAFDGEEQAVAMANDTVYGLSSYLYTENFSRAMRMSHSLRSGEVFINRGGPEEMNGFHGGWGESGLGGDDGTHGLELYRRKKSVYAAWSAS
ncbi:aldehyde dehydrogenase family protein [Microbacterium sp. UBA3394]|mgnify:CR=1 FL=1|uniref:aldehyde dehydrogenase family protein n=1 Tax=Microbacterium sp. UBA3394 TaxID=1946945 RepID=UPI00257D7E80|nr:aldehyde dehydrogenase family protein [Microbacterium sp. UBA3394]|tara:strand:- start:6516 stop:7970 length:1455 start_codon:yes stop_codon:yes gene_type:complete